MSLKRARGALLIACSRGRADHVSARSPCMFVSAFIEIVEDSAGTPVLATRNCAVDYCIAASIGVTDIRVQ